MGGDDNPPFLFRDIVYSWLDVALDYGISEFNYWDMTLAEVKRQIESKKRQMKMVSQEKAMFDYILGDLIGRSISRIYSASGKYPQLIEAYPSLFDGEVLEAQRQSVKNEISINRFKQFAQAFNSKMEVDKGE